MAEIKICKDLIKDLKPLMNDIGFISKSSNFIKKLEDNFGIINFQKSRDSNADFLKFTINFGVYSDILGKLEYFESKTNPEIIDCQWQARVGQFMDGRPDYWWEIFFSDDPKYLTIDVFKKIDSIILPEIEKRMSIDGLISCWLNEDHYGTTEISRFKYLTYLLTVKRNIDMLSKEKERFLDLSKGKPNYLSAIQHIKEIESMDIKIM